MHNVKKIDRPWDQTNLVLNSIEKVKTVFFFVFTFLNVCLFWIELEKVLISQHSPFSGILHLNFHFFHSFHVYCRPEWTKGETSWKWILVIFKYKTEYQKQLGVKKVDEENLICQVSFFSSGIMVLTCQK